MPSETIQWYPGHMAKTGRMIREMLPEVDFVIEICDARIPVSSLNPQLKKYLGPKPCLRIFSKSDLADPSVTVLWKKYFASKDEPACFADLRDGKTVGVIKKEAERLMASKLDKYRSAGMSGRPLRAMVVGIPNTGKSTLLNHLAGQKKARTEDRPGVTREKQWIVASKEAGGFELLDTPGILWPKFDDRITGENLALTGAIRDEILDIENLALVLCKRLSELYPAVFGERYKCVITPEMEPREIFEIIARKRGFIISGGEIDCERTSVALLNEFRDARIGRISLEKPPC